MGEYKIMNLEDASQYINALYENRGVNKKKYVESTDLKKFGSIIDEDVSRMLQLIIQLTHPENILEIGTSIGYSTVSMAHAIKDYNGKIITIESDEVVARQAIKNFQERGLAEFIQVKIGDAEEIIPQIQEKFDIIFQDVGDKKLYPILLDDCLRILKPGGLLLAEDTLFPVMFKSKEHEEDFIKPIHKFNENIANNPNLESTILSIGDGLTIAYKKER
jgi:predicted O-methyltransferase YrrM